MNHEQIKAALGNVMDPDLKKDLVTLNMIEDIQVEGNNVSFRLVLTTPACPLKDHLRQACIDIIHQQVSPAANVQIEMTSRVTSRRKETDQMLKDVKNIIAVGSGKGGVGKSTVAVNLAIALANAGAKVGLIDADIYGPSIPMMFGLINHRPEVVEKDGKAYVIPVPRYGIRVLSIGFFVDQTKALVWRGPMASVAIRQLFTDAIWGELDYLVLDLPPGTGDIPLTLVQDFPLTGAIVVTTPQEVAIADVRKAADMFRNEKIHIPMLGVVENMSYFIPPDMPEKKYYIFGEGGTQRFADEMNVPVLARVPFVMDVAQSGDTGNPVAMNDGSPVADAFRDLAAHVAQQVAITNAIKSTFNS